MNWPTKGRGQMMWPIFVRQTLVINKLWTSALKAEEYFSNKYEIWISPSGAFPQPLTKNNLTTARQSLPSVVNSRLMTVTCQSHSASNFVHSMMTTKCDAMHCASPLTSAKTCFTWCTSVITNSYQFVQHTAVHCHSYHVICSFPWVVLLVTLQSVSAKLPPSVRSSYRPLNLIYLFIIKNILSTNIN